MNRRYRVLAVAVVAFGVFGLPREGRVAAGVAAGGFTTYLGGSSSEDRLHVRVDGDGNTYVVGTTDSRDFPGSRLGRGKLGNEDYFAAKYAPSGQLVYARLVGAKQEDSVRGVEVDDSGCLHIAGITGSKKFPTVRAFQAKYRGQQDAFLMKLGPSGDVVYSSLLGGKEYEEFRRLRLDEFGNAYVVGGTRSPDFPSTSNAYIRILGNEPNPTRTLGPDGFITKFAPDGQVVYSTFVGGWQDELLDDITLVEGGDAIVFGGTASNNLRMVNAFQPSLKNFNDGYVVRLDAGGAPVFSTYIGGSQSDAVYRIAVDAEGNIILNGATDSSDFPAKNAFQTPVEVAGSFVAKLSPTGSLVYSTYIGGTVPYAFGSSLFVDRTGSAYVVGQANYGTRELFPFVHAFDTLIESGLEVFFTKLDSDGACVVSTALGGRFSESAHFADVDAEGNCFIAGETTSSDFPTHAAYQESSGSNRDLFLAKFDASGSLAFSTYIGGGRPEAFSSARLGADGYLYVVGVTGSDDLPVTAGSLPHGRSDDAFAARFDGRGVPAFVTYLGGQNSEGRQGLRMEIDDEGRTYIVGDTASSDFPVVSAVQPSIGGGEDAFVSVLGPDGRLRFSTFVGGLHTEYYFDMALGSDGAVCVWFQTSSPDVPTRFAAQPALAGGVDALVCRIIVP